MPSYYFPACYLRKGTTDYLTSRMGGLKISYRPNSWQMATCIMDNTDGSVTGVFVQEDAVKVKVESVEMLDGYVLSIKDRMVPATKERPSRRLLQEIIVADKNGLLAAKTPFKNNYPRKKTFKKLFEDVAGTIGATHSVSAGLTDEFKQDFFGSYCRDALNVGAQNGGADWFFRPEDGVLEAFEHEGRALTTGALAYQVQDIPSGGSHQVVVHHGYEYWIDTDSIQRHRNVEVANVNWETFPKDIHAVTSQVFWNGTLGYNYARWISAIEFTTNRFRAAKLEPGPPIGGSDSNELAPAIAFETLSTSDKLMSTFWYVSSDDTSMADAQFFGLPVGSKERISLALWTDINLADASEIRMDLIDQTTATFYHRNIKGDLNGSSVWTFLQYNLPTVVSGPSGTVSNGWTKSGSLDFNKIDTVFITYIKASSGQNTGWPTSSKIKYALFFFSGRISATASGAGGLNTTKLIVNNSVKNKDTLLVQAQKELARIGSSAISGLFVCQGHTDFKRPGYTVDYNFNQTFGSGHSGTARMDEIEHYLDQDGRYLMKIHVKPAFQRV